MAIFIAGLIGRFIKFQVNTSLAGSLVVIIFFQQLDQLVYRLYKVISLDHCNSHVDWNKTITIHFIFPAVEKDLDYVYPLCTEFSPADELADIARAGDELSAVSAELLSGIRQFTLKK